MRDVSYRYAAGTSALDGVSLEVRPGAVHAVVGGTGSGRTTLIRLVAGLARPSTGTVTAGGTSTAGVTAADLAWTVGTVLQNPDEQISERTVREELAFPLRRRRYERTGLLSRRERFGESEIGARVEQARRLAGLDEALLDEDPILLPRARRKEVTIAAALVLDPQVVTLDEPTVGFGADERRRFRRLLDRLREGDKAVLLVDNDVDLICAVADTVTVLAAGRVVAQGPLREVFAPDRWDALTAAHVHPSEAARLAQRLGLDALITDDLIAGLGPHPVHPVPAGGGR